MGPYPRFELHAPPSWTVHAHTDDLLHLEPDDDIALTASWRSRNVYGPAGLADLLAETAAIPAEALALPGAVVRWDDDAWAASVTLRDAPGRVCRLLAVGHDPGGVAMVLHGSAAAMERHGRDAETMLGTLRLPPAHLLSPEQFPRALFELLNDRAVAVRQPGWEIVEDGSFVSGELVLRPGSLYRAYLKSGDLDAVAERIDSVPRGDVARRWADREWEDVRSHVRVVLRRDDAVAALDIVAVPVADGLVACPVLDSPDRMTFIPRRESHRWGLDAEALLTCAVGALPRVDAAPDGALDGLVLQDPYVTGTLLRPEEFARLSAALGSPLLVAMPSSRAVHVCRDSAAARCALADEAATRYRDDPRPLSERVWLWSEDGLQPLPQSGTPRPL
jgi:hypothetical protein